ncbi:MAG TPA: C2 family cysteine protease [Humisphaera sp.]
MTTRTPARARRTAAVRQAAVEALEGRQLMSATLSAGGYLEVLGTAANDAIQVSRDATYVYVKENGVQSKFPAAGLSTVAVSGLDGNDVISVASNITVRAKLYGGNGNDTLTGGSGKDDLRGEAGDDVLDGGLGGDTFNGGLGADTVSYATRTGPVTLNLRDPSETGTPDDGAAGEGDIILDDNERFQGGAGNDVFIGTKAAERFYGNGGNDSISAGGGNDVLFGGDGNDTLDGGEGNDSVVAGAGNDMLYGKEGDDLLSGEGGDDFIDPGVGSDTVFGGAGADTVAYFTRTKDLTITLDGVRDDGEAGEADNVMADVENALAGSGNDRVVGSASANRLFGGGGNDTIWGAGGTDELFGEAGNDTLAAGGGAGNDLLKGGPGNDTLTAIGGGADRALGEDGNDIFWVDAADATDATAAESAAGRLIKVSSYANGASMSPDGQDLADPSLADLDERKVKYGRSFSDVPLFGPGGPVAEDVCQRNLGSCWFLAAAAGIARVKQDLIRTTVTALGDGTFAVRLFSGSTAKVYRVDAQLPVDQATGTMPQFATTANNTIWAAVVEKAMALHRTAGGKYKDAESGWSDEAYRMFGKTAGFWWTVAHSEDAMAAKMRDVLLKGGSVGVGTDPWLLVSKVENSHAYTVLSVSADLKTITLRNPWGYDGKGATGDPNDGIITMSMTQFDDDFQDISWSYL